jgi:ornithine cyclodeaminase
MNGPFAIYTIEDLRPLLDHRQVIEAVRVALIRHSAGDVQSPMPGELLFPTAPGDCHIKFGHLSGDPSFAIKVATGFYNNSARGLPVNNGLTLVFDAETGMPQVLFQDGGWLTAWRTAAATALAAHCLSPRRAPTVGIFGTGLQAQLSIEWIAKLIPSAGFLLLGRDPLRTASVAEQCGATAARSIAELMATSDIIVTATPSETALFDGELVRPGMHFVGVGADGGAKHELPVALFTKAQIILTDDHRQCCALSDFGRALRVGAVAEDADQAFGSVLGGLLSIERQPEDITIVDLTGLAAQDIAIANWFRQQLGKEAGRLP